MEPPYGVCYHFRKMNTEKELTKLKKELAELKSELAELKEFLKIEPIRGSQEKYLTITCSHIFLKNSDAPDELGGTIGYDSNGPIMELWGKDMLSRVSLEVEEDCGSLTIYGTKRLQGVELAVSQESQTGVVIVSHEGNPRVVIKGEEEGGFVGVVHDDALVRAAMQSRQAEGEIAVLNPDMQHAVTISTDVDAGGGYISLKHPNGRNAIVLGSDEKGGVVLFTDPKGKVIDMVPRPRREGRE